MTNLYPAGRKYGYTATLQVNEAGEPINSVASLSADVVEEASTTTPLVASAVFESEWFPISDYATVQVSARTDQASASNGLTIEQSDSNDVDAVIMNSRSTTVAASTANQGITMTVKNSYGRVRYVNGGSDQTEFNLETLLKPVATTDFPSIGPQVSAQSISIVPASDSPVFEITQLHRDEDSVSAYHPPALFTGAAVTTDNTLLVAAPSAGTHIVVYSVFVFRKETGTTAFDVGLRPGTGGADIFRPTLKAEGQGWQTNLARPWALATATALAVDLAGGTLSGGGIWVAAAYTVEVDS